MKIPVYLQEEICDAAVDDEVEIAVVKIVSGMEDGVVLPIVFMGGVVAEVLFYSPILGKGGEVDTAAGGACCAEQIAVADGEIEGAVPAHAEAGDGTMRVVGAGGVVGVDIGDQFFCDKRFITDFRVDGAVEIPAVEAAVRANEEDAVGGGGGGELWGCLDPLRVVTAVAVEKIDDGPVGVCGGLAGGADDDAFDVFIHRGAMDEDGVD